VNNLATRSITGAGFVVVMLGSALLGQMVFSFLFLLVTAFGLWEFYGLVAKANGNINRFLAVILGLVLYITLALNASGYIELKMLLINIPLLFLLFITELWRKDARPFLNIALELTGIIYIALPLGLSIYFFDPAVHSGTGPYELMVGYLIILWLNDTGAYFIGSLLGKHRLFERISPKKSWEGAAGGALFGLLTAYAASQFFTGYMLWQWIVIGLLTIIFGTLGDLVESLLKRSLNIKDSGTILPGHGGILDRFDAVFVSVPFVFVFLTLFCKN
jgi:phosphatidate cytidylyltransferase